MARVWTTLKFPIGANGVWYPLCRACDGVILIPLDPSKLAPGVAYLEGTILTGPVCIDNELVYTVDYEDSLLADPGSTLLQCDYRICCNDCSPKMVKLLTDLQNARIEVIENLVEEIGLNDIVHSVTGPLVDNTDPANPIILDETTTTLTSELVGGVENNYRVYSYTNEDGNVSTFVGGTSSIIAPNVNKGVGPGQSIEAMAVQGTQITLDTATMPTFLLDGVVGQMPGGPGINMTALGFYNLFDITLTLVNSNPRYTMRGLLFLEAKAFIRPLTDSARIKLFTSLTKVGDPLDWTGDDEVEATSTPPGGPVACVLQTTQVRNLNEVVAANIPPSSSVTLRLAARLENIAGGAPSTLLNSGYGGLRFQGVAAA